MVSSSHIPGIYSTKKLKIFFGTNGEAHPSDIFSLAVTPMHILSASGSASLRVHSTVHADFPLVQTLRGAHKLGCHHVVTSADGSKAASAGFEGDIKIWRYNDAVSDSSGGGGGGESNRQQSNTNVGAGGEWVSEGAVVGLLFLSNFPPPPRSPPSGQFATKRKIEKKKNHAKRRKGNPRQRALIQTSVFFFLVFRWQQGRRGVGAGAVGRWAVLGKHDVRRPYQRLGHIACAREDPRV
jgi:hypothetical protein